MAALQTALKCNQPDWLRIEAKPRKTTPRFAADSIPWFWCWMETPDMRAHANTGRPFVGGPNMYPERLLGAPNCKLIFVHSPHHLNWLERGSKTQLKDKAVFWPYPIDPLPAGPLAADYDVLIFKKKGTFYRPDQRT